jgi:hypothetical protein
LIVGINIFQVGIIYYIPPKSASNTKHSGKDGVLAHEEMIDKTNEWLEKIPKEKSKKEYKYERISFYVLTDIVIAQRETIEKHLGAIEWRNGDEVEYGKDDVDQYYGVHNACHWVRKCGTRNAKDEPKYKCNAKIGERPSERHLGIPPFLITEIVRIVGYRLCPTKHESPRKNGGDKWYNNRAHRVNVAKWVHGESPREARRRVTQVLRHVPMRYFVGDDGKDEHND